MDITSGEPLSGTGTPSLRGCRLNPTMKKKVATLGLKQNSLQLFSKRKIQSVLPHAFLRQTPRIDKGLPKSVVPSKADDGTRGSFPMSLASSFVATGVRKYSELGSSVVNFMYPHDKSESPFMAVRISKFVSARTTNLVKRKLQRVLQLDGCTMKDYFRRHAPVELRTRFNAFTRAMSGHTTKMKRLTENVGSERVESCRSVDVDSRRSFNVNESFLSIPLEQLFVEEQFSSNVSKKLFLASGISPPPPLKIHKLPQTNQVTSPSSPKNGKLLDVDRDVLKPLRKLPVVLMGENENTVEASVDRGNLQKPNATFIHPEEKESNVFNDVYSIFGKSYRFSEIPPCAALNLLFAS